MATAADLVAMKAEIESLLSLPGAKQLLQLNSNTCERAYEAYVFGLCCEAVRRAGGTVTLTGINTGANPSTVVFRGAPGSMASTSQNFVYADCSLSNRSFEIHVDVEYQGSSKALHEVDVSVCDTTPRASGNKLLMVLECKFYEKTPGVSLGRTFVGLISDCGDLRLKAFASNIPSDKLRQYFSQTRRPEPFLGLNPTDKNAEDRFVRHVEQVLRKWAIA
jgi:hypothetical protein